MGKFLNSFLEFKNEADATRKFALFAVVIITLGLASLSVTGIVATADWSVLSFMPIMGMIIAVLGAELLATVAFIRTLTASTKLRKVAGAFIFLGLAAVGVHNAENGAKVVWPDRFAESSSSLAAKSVLSQASANDIAAARTKATEATPDELERVRKEIADIQAEQELMASMTAEGIARAQALLLGKGLYDGSVDGIRKDKTESAMRERGETLSGDLKKAKLREQNLMSGQTGVVPPPVAEGVTPPADPAIAAIELSDKASAAYWNWLWLIIMLCTLEGARSLSLWALITDISSKDAQRDREWTDELAALRHQQERARIIAETNAAVAAYAPPPPVETPPAPIPEPEPMVLDTPAPAPADEPAPSWRPGILAANHAKAAKKAQAGKYILVPSLVARDADAQAAKLAAE